MTVYIVQVFLILLLGLMIRPKKTKGRKKAFLMLVFLLLVIISGFRAYSVGADTSVYVSLFEDIRHWELRNSRFEWGFMVYVWLLRRISEDAGLLLVVSSVLCIGSFVLFAGRYSKDTVLSMALYVLLGGYFAQMNTMRQELATAVSMLAIGLLIAERRLGRKTAAGLLILLAASFHTAALVVFLTYGLILMGDRKKNRSPGKPAWEILAVTLVIAAIVFLAYPFIMAFVAKVFPRFEHHFHGAWSDANYNAALFKTLIPISFAVAGASVFKNKKLNREQSVAMMMLGFSIIFNTLSMRMEIWSRLNGLFNVYTFLLWVPEFISEIRNQMNRVTMKMCILLFSTAYMLIVLIFRPEWFKVVPYLFR